jgi:uncharacterized protein YidB (DUF937 family)
MGLFDQLKDAALGAVAGGGAGQGKLFEALLAVVNSPQVGGVPGLLKMFEQQGLGQLVQSWVGAGKNLPLSAEQLTKVLGNPLVQQIAQKAGMAPNAAADGLAKLLPDVVDKLSPGGNLPDPQALMKQLDGLKGLFGK